MSDDDAVGEPPSDAAPRQASFVQFLSGMAAQTLVHLGAMENPLTGQVGVDLPNARYSIDILAIFKDKTQGNLNEEEAKYLDAVLRDLRVRYVQIAGESEGEEGREEI